MLYSFACLSLKGGWDTGVGRSSSMYPNSKILIEKLLANEARQVNLAYSLQ
jgi:hypothetical protein